MDNIRLGNTFEVSWGINQFNGTETVPYDLSGKNLTLILSNALCKTKVDKFSTIGNIISFTFEGKDQKYVGKYSLILIENDGIEGMHVVDVCDAFRLVNRSCETCDDTSSIIDCTHIDFSSTMLSRRGISAYEYAKLNGYDGTEEEYAADCRAIPDLKDEVDRVLDSLGFEEIEIQIEDLQNTKIDKEADDYYPQLSVGTADNLAGVDDVASEFAFRRSGGGAIADGVARVQRIKGNSVVWNNLVKWRGVGNEAKGLTISYNNGLLHVSGTPTESAVAFYSALYDDVSATDLFANGHYYAICGKSNHANVTIYGDVSITGNDVVARKTGDAMRLSIRVENLTIGESINESFSILIADLTKMFGSGNEPNTIEEFYQRIPMGVDLNAYNEGEVISLAASGIKSVGRNQWNEQWELGGINSSDGKDFDATNRIKSGYIRILANTKYYFKKPQGIFTLLCFYDENKNYVGYLDPFVTSGVGGVFTTMDAPYMRFMVAQDTYHHDICINLSDTDFNGQYEPYIEDSEDLSIVRKYFPNGMRSAGSAHDEIRYNKATNKWEKVVRIGEVDLGTLAWDYVIASDSTYSMMTDALKTIAMALSANNVVGNILCSKFISDSAEDVYNRKMPESIAIAPTGRITIFASGYTSRDSVAAFKAAMSGVMLYYELAEPFVTEIAEKDFNLDYKVWNCGTEQMVATEPSAPLAADITYGFNAVGLIKQLRSMIEALSAKVASL